MLKRVNHAYQCPGTARVVIASPAVNIAESTAASAYQRSERQPGAVEKPRLRPAKVRAESAAQRAMSAGSDRAPTILRNGGLHPPAPAHPSTRTPKPSSSATTLVSGIPITAVKSSPRTRSKSAMPSDSTRYEPAQSNGASLAT